MKVVRFDEVLASGISGNVYKTGLRAIPVKHVVSVGESADGRAVIMLAAGRHMVEITVLDGYHATLQRLGWSDNG